MSNNEIVTSQDKAVYMFAHNKAFFTGLLETDAHDVLVDNNGNGLKFEYVGDSNNG